MKIIACFYRFWIFFFNKLQHVASPGTWLSILAVCVVLPSITLGFVADDFVHRNIIFCDLKPFESGICKNQLADLWYAINHAFNFHDAENQTIRAGVQTGFMPWWSNPELHWSMARPLAAFFHWLDFALWPNSPSLMHVHNALWFGLLLFVMFKTAFRIAKDSGYQHTDKMLLIGSLIFIFDFSHFEGLYWLAARNMEISMVFLWSALYFYHRWSIEKKSLLFLISLFSFFGSLLSAEMGVMTVMVLAVYIFVFAARPYKRHALALLIYFVVFLFWKNLYVYLGFGNSGGQLYIDPTMAPFDFFRQMWQLLPIYIFAHFSAVDGFSLLLNKVGMFFYWLFCLVMVFYLLARARKFIQSNLWVLFCFLGFLACLIPICALPTERGRLLFSASTFGCFFLAAVIIELMKKFEQSGRVFYQLMTVVMFNIHIGLSVLIALFLFVFTLFGSFAHETTSHFRFEKHLDVENRSLVIINEPFYFEKIYWKMHANWYHGASPRNMLALFDGLSPVRIHRKTENLFLVESIYGLQAGHSTYLLNAFPLGMAHYFEKMDRHFIGSDQIFFVGMSFNVRDIAITVEAVNDFNRPTRVSFEFTQGLPSDQLWIYWDWLSGEYKTFQLPAIGEAAVIGGPFMDGVMPTKVENHKADESNSNVK